MKMNVKALTPILMAAIGTLVALELAPYWGKAKAAIKAKTVKPEVTQ